MVRDCSAKSPAFSPDGNEVSYVVGSSLRFVPIDGAGDVRSISLPKAAKLTSWRALPRPPGLLLAQSGGSTTVTEGGPPDTYTVALATEPAAQVTIYLATTHGRIVASPAEIVLRPADWWVPRTVTVSAVDDGFDDPATQVARLDHIVASQDPDYDGLVRPLDVLLLDDDDPWQYFALGDGVASGEGLPDGGLPCKRSPSAFPARAFAAFAQERTIELYNLACSATAAFPDAGAADQHRLGMQAAAIKGLRSNGPAIVSITVGGVDLGFTEVARARDWLCDKTEQEASDHVGVAAGRVRDALTTQVAGLLADSRVVVVLTQLYQPLNPVPSWLNNPTVVGGLRGTQCDLALANERSADGVAAVNAALAEARAAFPNDSHRIRVALVAELFAGREGGSPGCGAGPPAEPGSFVQHPGRGYTSDRQGDCYHPNERGTQALADAVVAAGEPPLADAVPPSTNLWTADGTILLNLPGIAENTVTGRSQDAGAGVSTVLVTFGPDTGSPTTVGVRCPRASRFSCSWSVAPPLVPGRYTVRARAVDRAGNVETTGASTGIVVV